MKVTMNLYLLIFLNNMNSIETSLIFSIYSDLLSPIEIAKKSWLKWWKYFVKWEKLVTPKWKTIEYENKVNMLKLYENNIGDDPEKVLQLFLDSLEPFFGKISDLRDVSIEFSIWIYHNGKLNWICISQELMHQMAKINSALDISLYDMSKK
jgi:hypothetical protein